MTDRFDAVALTQKLIRCRSVTPDDDGALALVEDSLRDSGFTVHKLRFHESGSYPVDNIFARIGNASPHICFLGHTDVVPSGREGDWTHPPFAAEIHDGILYGRGAADMKSGVAAALCAVARFIAENPDFAGSVSFLITGDEESESVNGTVRVVEWMKENDQMPDVALVAEPSNPARMGEMMRIGRRGSYHAALRVEGKQGHSAYPDRFINPVDKIVRLLHALIDLRLDNGTDRMPPSHIAVTSVDVGNPAQNVVAARAQAHLNIRFNDLWTSEKLTAKLIETLDAVGETYDLDVTPCNAESFMTRSLDWADRVADAVTAVTGSRPVYNTGGGTSDARFIAPYCPVVEYGVVTQTNHQVDECMRVKDIQSLSATYHRLLQSLFSVSPSAS